MLPAGTGLRRVTSEIRFQISVQTLRRVTSEKRVSDLPPDPLSTRPRALGAQRVKKSVSYFLRLQSLGVKKRTVGGFARVSRGIASRG
jgi:hypothetical protein